MTALRGNYSSTTPKEDFEKGIEVHRYYLELTIRKEIPERVLFTLMMNPSLTFFEDHVEPKIDPTIQNVCRLAYAAGYSKVVILNCYSQITPKLALCRWDVTPKNIESIDKILQKGDLLLAFGTQTPFPVSIYKILNKRKEKVRFLAFRINTSNRAPTHPSPRNRKYVNEALNREVENIFLTLDIEKENLPSKVGNQPSETYCRLGVSEHKH